MATKTRKKPAAKKARKKAPEPLFTNSDWTFESMERTYDAIAEIALEDLGLDIYPNQVEIISSEQMLDAYSSIGLPLMYHHWSFGKRFVRDETLYRKGMRGLAYEIVINSNPCISYNMEENTMAMQTLVMAHAAFGHNHFFKNNYLFQQWTDAGGILDYMAFARDYIARCEERHGREAVEVVLDAAHALMDHGVFRYRRPPKLNPREFEEREAERRRYKEKSHNELWRTLPARKADAADDDPEEKRARAEEAKRKKMLHLPQENLLYFLEKNSPILDDWQREIIRIVRMTAQYMYPQKQTKVMNEGCATFVHYTIVNKLFERGLITEGALMEILHSHTNVIFQPEFDDPRFSGLNPYALGFSMMMDIKRICEDPTDEDREWFPEFAGNGDWRATLKDAWANYRDESFIQQYLSPHLIRKLKLFVLDDDADIDNYEVSHIHNSRGYSQVRQILGKSYDLSSVEPNIQVVDVDLRGDRHLQLEHEVYNGIPLDEKNRDSVLQYLKALWGYDVTLVGRDQRTEKVVYRASTKSEGEED